jgi:hypothetical protein
MTKRVSTQLYIAVVALATWAAMVWAGLVSFLYPHSYSLSLWVNIPLALVGALATAICYVAGLVYAEEPRAITARDWTVSFVGGLVPGACLIAGVYLLRGY